jgi:hypothetical protein
METSWAAPRCPTPGNPYWEGQKTMASDDSLAAKDVEPRWPRADNTGGDTPHNPLRGASSGPLSRGGSSRSDDSGSDPSDPPVPPGVPPDFPDPDKPPPIEEPPCPIPVPRDEPPPPLVAR